MDGLWTNWPTRDLTGLVKFYILAQCAFWIQQIVIIHIEERRKDHWQMLAHHIVTISLIYSCYAYHQTRVGNLILVTMDFVDIILPVSTRPSFRASLSDT
jgi:acyl-CoA-dependent ceramide synthase